VLRPSLNPALRWRMVKLSFEISFQPSAFSFQRN